MALVALVVEALKVEAGQPLVISLGRAQYQEQREQL
jgi:hypothetical protein